MMKPEIRRELDYLLTLSFEGGISDPERERLHQLMEEEGEIQDYCMRYSLVAAGLRHPHLTAQGLPFPQSNSQPKTKRWRWIAGSAAAVILVLLGSMLIPGFQQNSVAVLADTINPQWQAKQVFQQQQKLRPGPFALESGFAKLRFHNGVTAVIEGPAQCTLETSDRLTLEHGKIFVETSPEVAEFTIVTHETIVRDLGTAFGVEVDQLGNTEVQMYEGEAIVQLDSRANPTRNMHLGAGRAGRVLADNGQWDAFPWEERAFLRDFNSAQGIIFRGKTREIAVNCGGEATERYLADCCFTHPNLDSGREYRRSHFYSKLADVPDEVIRTERYFPQGQGRYTFSIPNGTYTVELTFAEIYFHAQDKRVFHVDIQGHRRLENFDIFARTGQRGLALQRIFPDIFVQDGKLTIDFIRVIENPKISGIRIYRKP